MEIPDVAYSGLPYCNIYQVTIDKLLEFYVFFEVGLVTSLHP